MIYVTNQMSEVKQLCDEVVVFHEGKTTFQGEVDALVDKHSAPRLSVRTAETGLRPGGALAHAGWRPSGEDHWEIRGGAAVDLWAQVRKGDPVESQGVDEVAFHAADVEDAFVVLTNEVGER